MYQNIANQNSLLNNFNGYITQNPNNIPFQNNQLINNNPHVANNLNNLLQQHKTFQQNLPVYQQQLQNQQLQNQQNLPVYQQQKQNYNTNKNNKSKLNNGNIIEEMLKPQKILRDNKDVKTNYNTRKDIQEKARKNVGIKITNAPYKSIIKDKIINKDVGDIKEKDLLVHKANKEIDADRNKFDIEYQTKKNEKKKINDELKIEFHIDNYDKHKKKFEFKETFIKNLAFEENTYDENKQDVIEFYKKQKKEAIEGQILCDNILHNLANEGIISKDEIPTERSDTQTNSEIDLNSMIKNINTDDESNVTSDKSNILNKHDNKTINNLKSVSMNSKNSKLISNKRVNSNKIVNV